MCNVYSFLYLNYSTLRHTLASILSAQAVLFGLFAGRVTSPSYAYYIKYVLKPFIQIKVFGNFKIFVALFPLFVKKKLFNKSFEFIGIEKECVKKF